MSARRSILDTAAWLTRRIFARWTWVISRACRSSSSAIPERYLAANARARSCAAEDILLRRELKFLGTLLLLFRSVKDRDIAYLRFRSTWHRCRSNKSS